MKLSSVLSATVAIVAGSASSRAIERCICPNDGKIYMCVEGKCVLTTKPGSKVGVGGSISFVLPGGGTPPNFMGFASTTFQPVVSGFLFGTDSILPLSSNGEGVPELGLLGGRVIPFDSTPMSGGSPSGVLTTFIDPMNVLRFAGSKATTISTNLAWGVTFSQLPPAAAGTNFNSSTEPFVFKFDLQLGNIRTERFLTVSVPYHGILNQRATYYTSPGGATAIFPIEVHEVYSALIHVLPCNGSCISDVDDGTGTGAPDGGVGIEDLLYYLSSFDEGTTCADVDDGLGTGTPDGGVTIEDLLYYLERFDSGC